jgi:hypothetical protein
VRHHLGAYPGNPDAFRRELALRIAVIGFDTAFYRQRIIVVVLAKRSVGAARLKLKLMQSRLLRLGRTYGTGLKGRPQRAARFKG